VLSFQFDMSSFTLIHFLKHFLVHKDHPVMLVLGCFFSLFNVKVHESPILYWLSQLGAMVYFYI
jgi:hypothetical protein